MAKNTHPLESAFLRLDDSFKRFFNQIDNSFKGIEKIPEVSQPKKRVKKTFYSNNPFGKI
tara:strand:- start:39 stop:218 length:180 start_codon:yes stop_codon:yes gene_type:complete